MRVSRAFGAASVASVAVAQCYLPNGTDRRSVADIGKNTFKPCNSSGHSMCCNTYTGDVCRDGLCWNNSARLLWRESCTDPTWQSTACLKLCIDSNLNAPGQSKKSMAQTDVVVTQCSDGSYCCGNGDLARKCCQSGKGVKVVNGQVVASASSAAVSDSASATVSVVSVDTSPASATDSATDTTEAETPSNQAAVIGGAVGGGLAAVLLIGGALGFVLYRRKRGTRTTPTPAEQPKSNGFESTAEEDRYKEMAADHQRYELDAGIVPDPVPR